MIGLSHETLCCNVNRHARVYTLEQRMNFKLYVLVYRSLHSQASTHLCQFFTLRADGPHTEARTRGQATAALVLPDATSRYGYHSIAYLGADRWNALPLACRKARSPADFRTQVKKFLGFPIKRRRRLLGLP